MNFFLLAPGDPQTSEHLMAEGSPVLPFKDLKKVSLAHFKYMTDMEDKGFIMDPAFDLNHLLLPIYLN